MRRAQSTVLIALLLVACKNKPDPEETEFPPEPVREETPPETEVAGPIPCCKDWEDVKTKDGKVVVVEGLYETVHVTKKFNPVSEGSMAC